MSWKFFSRKKRQVSKEAEWESYIYIAVAVTKHTATLLLYYYPSLLKACIAIYTNDKVYVKS